MASGNFARKACAAGRVWITSPMALSRTIRSRSMFEPLSGPPIKVSSAKAASG